MNYFIKYNIIYIYDNDIEKIKNLTETNDVTIRYATC